MRKLLQKKRQVQKKLINDNKSIFNFIKSYANIHNKQSTVVAHCVRAVYGRTARHRTCMGSHSSAVTLHCEWLRNLSFINHKCTCSHATHVNPFVINFYDTKASKKKKQKKKWSYSILFATTMARWPNEHSIEFRLRVRQRNARTHTHTGDSRPARMCICKTKLLHFAYHVPLSVWRRRKLRLPRPHRFEFFNPWSRKWVKERKGIWLRSLHVCCSLL